MSVRIIISTNWSSLNFLSDRNQKGLYHIKTYSFIGFNHEERQFEENKVDSDIILIQDTATKEKLEKEGLVIKKETDYFLHHNTNGLSDIQNDLFINCVKGNHESGDRYKYEPVFNILLDDNNNKLKRILDVLDFSDEKIEQDQLRNLQKDFFHDCRTKEKIPDDIPVEFIRYKENFIVFKEDVRSGKDYVKSYIKFLEAFEE